MPPDFEWPSDELHKRAHSLYGMKSRELLNTSAAEYLEVLEALLLDGREESAEVARRLIERMAVNFASQDAFDRKKAADQFSSIAKKGTQELRARYFAIAARRLCDALELETSIEVFERLAECAKIGILDRISEGDWTLAARLTRSLGLKKEAARAEANQQLRSIGKRVLGEILVDPRSERVFETIERGSQQQRRKAARVLESMGGVAVDRLVRALKETERPRVENFLIDMLAALAPRSETAIKKEVTPHSTPEVTQKLLRAATVVCQDATAVFVSGLQNPDQVVQTVAVGEARKVGGRVAQNVLRWALDHGTNQVQLEAVKHLGELARADSVDHLLALVQNTNLVEVQRECCLAFGKLALDRGHHEKVIPVLSNMLRAGGFLRQEYHEDVRAAAAWALGQMKAVESARKALERVLDDKNKNVKLTARLMLGK